MKKLSYIHRFVEGKDATLPTLLLLHGTGGSEEDLIHIGEALLPSAPLLSPRGNVDENGLNRFFLRKSNAMFDLEDLAKKSAELIEFIQDAAKRYGFDAKRVIVVGFSNGANIATSILFHHPETFMAACLLRPMLPYHPASVADLSGKPIFIAAGMHDEMVPPEQVHHLKTILTKHGAKVTVQETDANHRLTSDDIEPAKKWVAAVVEQSAK